MGRAPCCDKANVKRGPWSPEEDTKLKEYIEKFGTGGNWIALPQKAGLRRCGKSCRLRWLNYLRPNIKHGEFSDDEDRVICNLFANIGSRWSIIAAQLPGRTDNDIKNYWNTKLKKKLMGFMAPNYCFQKKPMSSSNSFNSSSNGNGSAVSLFQGNISPLLLSSSSPSPAASTRSSFYNETMSLPSTPFLQSQDGYVGPLQNDNVTPFFHIYGQSSSISSSAGAGGDQASCSNSSDGNLKEVDHYDQQYYGAYDQSNMNIMGDKGVDGNSEKGEGLYGESSLDCSLEEIKQLISTNLCNNLNFFVDENKAEEKVLYYYS